MEVSAELLGQSDDDALRATQEAEPVDVLELRDLADELGTVAAQAGNDVVDVVDSEHDAAYAQRVRRRAFRLGSPYPRSIGVSVYPDEGRHPYPEAVRVVRPVCAGSSGGCARHDSNMRPLPPQGRPAVGPGWREMAELGSRSRVAALQSVRTARLPEGFLSRLDMFWTFCCRVWLQQFAGRLLDHRVRPGQRDPPSPLLHYE
jgi:hypothetical protein